MIITEFDINSITDRLEGWELVEFLQVPIELLVEAAIDNDWINADNLEDVREFVGVKE